MEGYEYSSNRLFYSHTKARMKLIMSGFKQVDDEELIFKKDGMKAVITEREIE